MERRLYEAAVEGNVNSFLKLVQEDELILDRYIIEFFTETPLHIVAMLGHTELAKEILSRKPELAGEVDSRRRSSPLHLASAKGYQEIVKALLLINPEMCNACDRDGRNPLHIAAMKGRVSVLKELIEAQPNAALVLVHRGETILHLCVQYNQLEALRLIVEAMGDREETREFVNSKNGDGNTILHLAVADKQIETVNFVLACTSIEVNAANAYGLTAMDVLAQSGRDVKDMEIGETLQHAGAVKLMIKAAGIPLPMRRRTSPSSDPNDQSKQVQYCFKKQNESWLEKQQSALMVVASLIATMAYQAAINPPDSIKKENYYSFSSSRSLFLMSNTIGFLASLSIILLLISGLPVKHKVFVWSLMFIMWVAVTSMSLTYMVSISLLQTHLDLNVSIAVTLCMWIIILVGLLLLAHFIRLIVNVTRKKRRSPARSLQNSITVDNIPV